MVSVKENLGEVPALILSVTCLLETYGLWNHPSNCESAQLDGKLLNLNDTVIQSLKVLL